MIEIQNLNKHFGSFHALKNINLTVPTGSLSALLGPSGCGKTTLLRIIAGLEHADGGKLLFDGEDISQTHVRERKIGFMFQHYALFRHMNVFDNIAFGLTVLPRKQRPSQAQIQAKVSELLQLVQLEHLAKAYPDQLSGGQRQRIALARALATEPKLLLLDEPFGALDAKVRKELRQWLHQIHQELGFTGILVTHDQEEAIELADEIVLMNHGIIEQSGSSENLYNTPKNQFVTEFLGEANAFSQAHIEHGQLHIGNYRTAAQGTARQNVHVYVRPHELSLSTIAPSNAIGSAQIQSIHTVGAMVRVVLNANGKILHALLPHPEFRQLNLTQGATVWYTPQNLTVFPTP